MDYPIFGNMPDNETLYEIVNNNLKLLIQIIDIYALSSSIYMPFFY